MCPASQLETDPDGEQVYRVELNKRDFSGLKCCWNCKSLVFDKSFACDTIACLNL